MARSLHGAAPGAAWTGGKKVRAVSLDGDDGQAPCRCGGDRLALSEIPSADDREPVRHAEDRAEGALEVVVNRQGSAGPVGYGLVDDCEHWPVSRSCRPFPSRVLSSRLADPWQTTADVNPSSAK